MISGRTADTVRAIVDAIIRQSGEQPERIAAIDPVVLFVLRTLAAMPTHLRLPLLVLTRGFGEWPLMGKRRPFHRLPLQQRLAQIGRWKAARFGFQRSLIVFYATFAIYGLYSELYGGDFASGDSDG